MEDSFLFDKCGNKMKKKLQKGGWIDKKKNMELGFK